MKVCLAGYNVDVEVLKELQDRGGKRQDVTPEVLSAAYARISRDPRSISAIRKDARDEVERARKSNSTIIFKMGHHSVAEHAVFNLDILGISRYAMEELEKFRLCSYTEKSQRYITLDKDYLVPEEIKGSGFERPFVEMIHQQNEAYLELFKKLKTYTFKKHSDLAKDAKKHSLLEGWAKEDARYITSLATESQVGQTINARNLELLLRRFASHPLDEVRKLGQAIYEQISEIAPSIILFNQANDRDQKTYPELKNCIKGLVGGEITLHDSNETGSVRLVEYTQDADTVTVASLIHSTTDRTYKHCRLMAEKMSRQDKEKVFAATWQNMQFYDSMLREFEYINFTFDVVLSAACFGQLKRHRMSTITSQSYDPDLGVTIPEAIKEIDMEGYFLEIVEKTNIFYRALVKETPLAAPYILTNAHRRRVLIRLNARELYHVSRLREDVHAQWDIKQISRAMTAEAKKNAPLTFAFIGGKDKYNEVYQTVFGRLPTVTQAVLPGSRKIK